MRFDVSLVILTLFLASCSSAPVRNEAMPVKSVMVPATSVSATRQDIVHVVGPSETVWRLSKMYDVKIDDIVRANNLSSSTKLEMGQKLLIPRAAPLKPVVPLYKTNKWQYIIIHHSASDEGNSLFFRKVHRSKGWNEIGYDFVIDNGSMGKADGQIEVGPRWIKQQNGAHCAAGGMNYKGIGICLVGNFSKERVSQKQLESLDYLVNLLRKYYNIPLNRIMGHSQVTGAKTECPGKLFPWKEFRERLAKGEA
jgi:LysM repeat protein